MRFSPYVMELLRLRSGRRLRLPADSEWLALDIEAATGEHIGVNTLKRLLGIIADERVPREATLDIIARYLGYDGWASLRIFDDKSNSSFDVVDGELRVQDLSVGQQVQVSYCPDRKLCLEYQGNGRFLVLSAVNSKLGVGDELYIDHLVCGYPLLVSEVVRHGTALGSFTAGMEQGIDYIVL